MSILFLPWFQHTFIHRITFVGFPSFKLQKKKISHFKNISSYSSKYIIMTVAGNEIQLWLICLLDRSFSWRNPSNLVNFVFRFPYLKSLIFFVSKQLEMHINFQFKKSVFESYRKKCVHRIPAFESCLSQMLDDRGSWS